MNKTAIKNFAIWARVQLIEAAKQRAYEYEITEKGENKTGLQTVGGCLLDAAEKKQRDQLIDQIKHKGYTQVMEEAAYTWFNRFIALRFMEVNGFLPSKIRVFTDENGAFKPEILKEAMTVELEGLDRSYVLELLDKQNNEALYKYLLITQCNELNQSLPCMFEKISNWTELLFPANLLRADSIIGKMVADIPEEDWTDAVQIIGWLYQYYNTELKDDTFALLKKNVKISKERIPAATQLFTPDWIVRYMVENSLGRLWLEGHPNAELRAGWKYYLDEAEQEPAVAAKLAEIRKEYAALKPEDIKVIDPCMGSGHILVYAFDVLMQIYTACGWSDRDAAKSILENNLYGLDIDDRAGQLAYFAVMMKARKYSRRILNSDVKPHVMAIQDSGFMTDDLIAYVAGKDTHMKADLTLLRSTFKDAKEYGSILNVPKLNFAALYERIDIIGRSFAEDIFQIEYQSTATEKLLPLVKQAEVMAQKYDVVVTNPPYMGASGMGAKLSEFVKKYYPDSKSDLFAVFIEKGNTMVVPNGFNCMVTMQSWMFLSSFEKMRVRICDSRCITNLMHMDNMVMGIAFGTAVTVLRNNFIGGYRGTYNHIKFADIVEGEPSSFPVVGNRFAQTCASNFSKVPGNPIAYWVSEAIYDALSGPTITAVCSPCIGMRTGDNERFLRLWYEVSIDDSSCLCLNEHEKKKWIPYNKGGSFRRWYGNNEYLVNWENNGSEIKANTRLKYGENIGWKISNEKYYFRDGFTWSSTTSGTTTFRYYPEGFIFSNKGQAIIMSSNSTQKLYSVGAYLNTKVVIELLKLLSPTVDCESGYVAKLPFKCDPLLDEKTSSVAEQNIALARNDWDAFETSWDFKKHPLV